MLGYTWLNLTNLLINLLGLSRLNLSLFLCEGKYKRGGSNATYYGKTKYHFKVQICEHLGISHLTGKKVKSDNNKPTTIKEHLLSCNYSPSYEEFSILIRRK